jgi:site-specific DNA-cytosine methylase
MKIIYLASGVGIINTKHQVTYQDINGKRDVGGDMLDVDLSPYDVIIATPPCNYYSRANYRRETSKIAQETKHLLPNIINKLQNQNKPYIVENVRNPNLFKDIINNFNGHIYIHGRHTYFTNIFFNPANIVQTKDFKLKICKKLPNGKWFKTGQTRIVSKEISQGGTNVQRVFEHWLNCL